MRKSQSDMHCGESVSLKPRPRGVKVVVALEVAAGLISLTVGFLPLIGTLLGAGQFGFVGIVLVPILLLVSALVLVVMVVIAALLFILAYRLSKGGALARKIALALSVVGLAFSLFFGLAGGWYSGPFLKSQSNLGDYLASLVTLSALVINVLVVYFLTREDVKGFFKK